MAKSALGYSRFRKRSVCLDDLFAVDIRQWKKDGILSYQSFDYTWRNHLGVLGSISFQWNDTADLLRYVMQSPASMDHRGVLEITTTDCHYGGERYWFQCPSCQRKVVKLYHFNRQFQCRHCCALPYKSQNETASDRNIRRVRSVRRLLGASDNILDPITLKPKGMHRDRFERLRRRSETIGDIYNKWANVSLGMQMSTGAEHSKRL